MKSNLSPKKWRLIIIVIYAILIVLRTIAFFLSKTTDILDIISLCLGYIVLTILIIEFIRYKKKNNKDQQ